MTTTGLVCYMAFAKSTLCHPEGAFFSDRRIADAAVEMLRFAQHDMVRICQATLQKPYRLFLERSSVDFPGLPLCGEFYFFEKAQVHPGIATMKKIPGQMLAVKQPVLSRIKQHPLEHQEGIAYFSF